MRNGDSLSRIFKHAQPAAIDHRYATSDMIGCKVPLDQKIMDRRGSESTLTLLDLMRVDASQHEEAERAETADMLRGLLTRIDRRLAVIIVRRYWMEQTLEQVGAAMGGISRERVRQLEIQAHAALKREAGLPPAEPPLRRAHCIRGHDMRPRAARFLDARGTWLCRECRLAWERANYARKQAARRDRSEPRKQQAEAAPAVCAKGHDISQPGTYRTDSRGRRYCLTCHAVAQKARVRTIWATKCSRRLDELMGRPQ